MLTSQCIFLTVSFYFNIYPIYLELRHNIPNEIIADEVALH